MPPLSSPYRASARPVRTHRHETADPLRLAQRVVGWFVLGWALVRLAVCAVSGLDVDGFIALVVVVTVLVPVRIRP
jgi:hypothetical protein